MRRRHRFLGNFAVAIIAILNLFSSSTVIAQPAEIWSESQRIPYFHNSTLPPYVVADQNHTVHVFSSQPLNDDEGFQVIMYNQWTLEDEWTSPIDIILPPYRRQASIMGAFLDAAGMMHIVFFGGDDSGAQIYYTQAPAVKAGEALAWSPLMMVGDGARTPRVAALGADDAGNLVVVYSGNREGTGLYAVQSVDGGDNWTAPIPVLLTYDDKLKPFDVDVHLGQSGYFHVVWNITNELGHNVSGHYARLDIKSQQWSEPIEIAEKVGLGVAIPAVIEYADTVFLMYNNGLGEQVAPVHWMRQSADFGQSWSNPVQPFPTHIGRNGTFSFVVDSQGDLHLFFAQRIPGGYEGKRDLHGMWHSVWRNGSWTAPRAVVSGPQKTPQLSADTGFDPYDARAVVSQGNTILLTWRTDPGLSRDGVWYSHATLDTAELPTALLPVPTATPTVTPAFTPVLAIPTARLPLTPIVSLDGQSPEAPHNRPSAPLIVGIIPSALLITIVIIAGYRRTHRP